MNHDNNEQSSMQNSRDTTVTRNHLNIGNGDPSGSGPLGNVNRSPSSPSGNPADPSDRGNRINLGGNTANRPSVNDSSSSGNSNISSRPVPQNNRNVGNGSVGNNQNSSSGGNSNSTRRGFLSSWVDPDSTLGRLINRRSSNTPTSNRNRTSNSNSGSWKPWLFLAIIILGGVFYSEKLPFPFDRSLDENLNLYLTKVEGTNQYPLNRAKTGNDIYDKDLILPEMVTEMGHERYLIYVYTFDKSIDKKFNGAITEYKKLDKKLPLYKVQDTDQVVTNKDDFFAGSPKIVEMMRIDQEAIPVAEYLNPEDWKKEWKNP